jgi:uncharacterized OB-fold protein
MIRIPQTEQSPLPEPDDRSAPYWDALTRAELLLQRCAVCQTLNHPAAECCRVCESTQLLWSRVEPRARLFSWVVETRAIIPGVEPPYVIAQVTPVGCEDGAVRLVCTLLVDDLSALAFDMPLRLETAAVPGASVRLAYFVPD